MTDLRRTLRFACVGAVNIVLGAGALAPSAQGRDQVAVAGLPVAAPASLVRVEGTDPSQGDLPLVAARFGRGRLIKDATAGRVGSELVVAFTVAGKTNARRNINFRITSGRTWITPDVPPVSISRRETFFVTGLGRQLCLVANPAGVAQLRCVVNGKWNVIGSRSRITGIRSVNDVVTVDGAIYATTGGTGSDHVPQVHIIRWRDGLRQDLGAVPAWAAQRGYFAVGRGDAAHEVCGAFNNYSEPEKVVAPPIGTFCVHGNRVGPGVPVPNGLIQTARIALPTATKTSTRYDLSPSGRLADGTWAVSAIALGREGAGTLAFSASRESGWQTTALSTEQANVNPYGGIWTVGNTAYLLNAEQDTKLGVSRMTVASLSPGASTATRISLATAKSGHQIALGVYEHSGTRYALFSDSRPSGPARVLSVPLAR